jgi:hypothetical protein
MGPGEGRGSGQGRCGERWSSGGPFYKCPGKEAAKSQLAPARGIAAAMMAHSAEDETARGMLRVRVLAQCTWRAKRCLTPLESRAVRERGWRLAGFAPVKSRAGTKGLTSGARLLEGERRERVGRLCLTGGAGRSAGEGKSAARARARGRMGRVGREQREGNAGMRGREGGAWAGSGPAEREGFSFFPFSISFLFSFS